MVLLIFLRPIWSQEAIYSKLKPIVLATEPSLFPVLIIDLPTCCFQTTSDRIFSTPEYRVPFENFLYPAPPWRMFPSKNPLNHPAWRGSCSPDTSVICRGAEMIQMWQLPTSLCPVPHLWGHGTPARGTFGIFTPYSAGVSCWCFLVWWPSSRLGGVGSLNLPAG